MKRNIELLTFFFLLLSLVGAGILLKSQTLAGGKAGKKTVSTTKPAAVGGHEDFTDMMNGIHFDFCCSLEALVIDPLGRKLGYDPIKKKRYDEIPRSGYGGPVRGSTPTEALNPPKEIEIVAAINGDYIIKVTGTKNGKYGIGVSTHNTARQSFDKLLAKDIPILPNIVHVYSVHYDSANLSATTVSGGFDGGGQRPKDVNKFLTYANPSDSQTDLPSGTTVFPLMIFYGNNAITSTFKASLNGVDVTSLFNPNPGSHETVNLLLSPGRNVLLLSTDGNLPSRIATDTDRLVFIVK